jgi:hypothetical protein
MPIKPQSGETEREYISRCIRTEIDAGYSEEQAASICYNTWNTRMKKQTPQDRVKNKLKEAREKRQELITPNPCESGYIAIGLKPKGGRMVPNCVPRD